ncbi:MAG TPA: serine hydrolase domain-containing protein [Flavisolibacter sp.]|nr:serine hydrolase domain-containing protein [Flavisolibacter sp.]
MKPLKLTVLLLFPLFLFSQTSYQKERLTRLTEQLIDLYNARDTAGQLAFIRAAQPGEEKAQQFLHQLQEEQAHLGAIKLHAITVKSDQEAEALVQTPQFETWWRVIVLTDSAQRFREHHMGMLRVTEAVLQSGPECTRTQLAKEIEGYITRQSAYMPFSGNVYVAHKGTVLYSRSFGKDPKGVMNTAGQSFDLASVGKLFTSISVLQLISEGKVSIESTVGSLLPELKNQKLQSITIRQLLTHTSGMGDFFEDPDFARTIDSIRKNEPLLSESASFRSYFEKDSLRFAPGTNWSYSNTGYELLGYLVERLSGTDYKSYITTHIFQPAGMKQTKAGSGAGAGTSTVHDLTLFVKALQGKKLLGQYTDTLLTYRANDFYGYGTEHTVLGREHITGHSGGFENVCNELNIYQRSGYLVIILSNSNPPFGHFLSDKIKELLVRKAG